MPFQVAAAIYQSSALVKQILDQSDFVETGVWKVLGNRLSQSFDSLDDEHLLGFLPLLSCTACGGDINQAIPLVAAWRSLRLSAKLLDDVADGESIYPPSEAISLATAFLFLAPRVLKELLEQGVSPDMVESLFQSLYEAGLQACAGQHAELTTLDNASPNVWLDIAQAKSGNPCAWAAWAGALIGEATEEVLADFYEYGMHSGILLQIADDFNDVWSTTKSSDLRSGQLNLAVCYARLVAEGKQRILFEDLLDSVKLGDTTAVSRLNKLLVDVGAQAYLLVVGHQQRQQAIAALGRHGMTSNLLIDLLNQMWPAISKAEEK